MGGCNDGFYAFFLRGFFYSTWFRKRNLLRGNIRAYSCLQDFFHFYPFIQFPKSIVRTNDWSINKCDITLLSGYTLLYVEVVCWVSSCFHFSNELGWWCFGLLIPNGSLWGTALSLLLWSWSTWRRVTRNVVEDVFFCNRIEIEFLCYCSQNRFRFCF